MAQTNCRYFSGYKPCGKIDSLTEHCNESCRHLDVPTTRVLMIHLGALGAVVRSTTLLPAIHKKYPGAHVTWVTDPPGDVLLRGNPLIDRVVLSDSSGVLELSALSFDVALVVDKSLKSAGLLRATKAKTVFGFVVEPDSGAILPATESARPLWEIGISNHIKFNVSRKPETQLVHEALELGEWERARYSLHLSESEKIEVRKRRHLWSLAGRSTVIGVNTGCALTIAAKKLSIDGHVRLLAEMSRIHDEQDMTEGRSEVSFVLLGGKEDTERNREIANRAGAAGVLVTESPTTAGLRDGMISVAACDVVVSGDSLGLHMALGFQKPVVAWFGPTCAHEIDLYGGVSIETSASCAPCWKRSCEKSTMCYDLVDFKKMAQAAIDFAAIRVDEPRPLSEPRGDVPVLEIDADL